MSDEVPPISPTVAASLAAELAKPAPKPKRGPGRPKRPPYRPLNPKVAEFLDKATHTRAADREASSLREPTSAAPLREPAHDPNARAEPARQPPGTTPEITRMSLEDRQMTTYDVPVHLRKPGWDYKWEVVTVMGQQVDRSLLRDAHRAGWRPELARDWPELAEGLKPDEPIIEGGQMLMGRPIHLSHEAQVEAYNRAKTQERDRMQAASTGQMSTGGEPLANVRGVRVGNASLEMQLASGSAPIFNGRSAR